MYMPNLTIITWSTESEIADNSSIHTGCYYDKFIDIFYINYRERKVVDTVIIISKLTTFDIFIAIWKIAS